MPYEVEQDARNDVWQIGDNFSNFFDTRVKKISITFSRQIQYVDPAYRPQMVLCQYLLELSVERGSALDPNASAQNAGVKSALPESEVP